MASNLLQTIANFETTLSAKLSTAGTSITLTSNLDKDGNAIPSGVYGFTLDEGKANEEHIIGTVASSSVTITTRNVSRSNGTTAGTGKTHRKGSSIKITNHPLLVRMRRLLDGTDGFNGSSPVHYDSSPTFTPGSNQFVTVAYADALVGAGVADATESSKGKLKLSVAAANVAQPIAVGDNDPRIPTQGENDALAGNSGTAVSGSNKLEDAADTSAIGGIAYANKLVRFDAAGKLAATDFDYNKLPLPAYFQSVPIGGTAVPTNCFGATCNQDGSILISGDASYLTRFARDSKTGYYNATHTVSISGVIQASFGNGLIIIGSYVYIFADGGTNMICRRFDLATLANQTTMTIPTIALSSTQNVNAWTDGTFAYVIDSANSTLVRKWSLSGTTFSASSTSTLFSNLVDRSISTFYDGTNAYLIRGDSNPVVIYKLTNVDGSTGSLVASITLPPFFNGTDNATGATLTPGNVDAERLYLGRILPNSPSTPSGYQLNLLPFTKP